MILIAPIVRGKINEKYTKVKQTKTYVSFIKLLLDNNKNSNNNNNNNYYSNNTK